MVVERAALSSSEGAVNKLPLASEKAASSLSSTSIGRSNIISNADAERSTAYAYRQRRISNPPATHRQSTSDTPATMPRATALAPARSRSAAEAKKLERTSVKISEQRLFNAHATTENVIEDIEELLLRLSPNHPEIAELLQTARAEPVIPFYIHGHYDDDGDNDTKTCPNTHRDVDVWFENVVTNAPQVQNPEQWLEKNADGELGRIAFPLPR